MSSFSPVEVNIVGGENVSRSRSWSSQSCVNLYTDIQRSGRTESALLPWPGEKSWSSGSSGSSRGMISVNGVPHLLNGRSLYKFDSDGTRTLLADVPGEAVSSMSTDGINIVIRTAGSCCYLNRKFILGGQGPTFLWNGTGIVTVDLPVIDPSGFVVSDVNDPSRYQSINRNLAQVSGDDIKQVFTFQRKIVMAGADSIEFFYDDENGGNPPIKPILQASSTQVGVASNFSMAETPSFLYFVGSDNVVYRMSSFQTETVSNSSISRELREVDTSDAQGFTCQIDGQYFYVIQLPLANRTLAFSEKTGEWIRLSTGLSLGKHLIAGYVFAYGKHLVADDGTSAVYEWDFDTFKSNGETIIRQIDTAPINGLSLGAPGQRLATNMCRFIMESGVSNGDDPEPQMMVSASVDGGRFRSNENWLQMRRRGNSESVVDWYHCTTFYDLVLRIRVSDPVFTSFHSATINLRAAGY